MRSASHLIVLTLGLVAATPAMAQAGASYPRPDVQPEPSPAPMRAQDPVVVRTTSVGVPPARANRWGSRVGGRWWGGANAPGGWRAYRRPMRGMTVPSYWTDRRFGVDDWAVYTLPQPPVGYHWSRYYDDAVLIDDRGSVYDSVYGVNWDGTPDYTGAPYAPPPPRRDDGLGGAAIGAVAGGVAGNLVGGRGNRLGGTLIGAGVGAAAGYAIDRAEDRGRRMEPGYDDYSYRSDAPPPPPPAMGRRVVTRDGTTVTTTTTVGTMDSPQAGYYADGYYYPAPRVTTVVVQGAPVISTTTTTTTEMVRSGPSRARVRGKLVRR
ncbi:RcnB family protein [Sphingomonas sanguinis]|uniref:17 kDa surface antigen n=1 Tax=Sphingomonas sanguinis TaxID=33051 RepID=A0ABU5LRL1_9SPHN|nr:RcnB family protein [Sphingomonas sanguinis]MDZ7282564.1 RcnB family protein [Sphingomonas sanguinis]